MVNQIKRGISLILIFSIIFLSVACESESTNAYAPDSSVQIITENIDTENIEVENIETEDIITEFITSEIYLEELVFAEDKISELLLEEETINEVMLCKTIYVPQNNIEEFSENSQTAQLFGEGIDIAPLLKKVALGTGVIVALVVLKTAGLSQPIASIVCAAADKSLKFAGSGAVMGSLLGGLTGAADAIDASGRTSAVIGFATAVAGLIVTSISLISLVPSAGSTTITAAAGIKLVIAGVSLVAAATGTTHMGANLVKAFTSTDYEDIDWGNIDWEKAGVSSAERAVRYGTDGYMWGSVIGAVYGGTEGYEFYQKYNTPYTKYDVRLKHTPLDGSGGKWSGERGDSDFILDKPIELPDGTKITKVTYKNAVPDFSPYQKAQVKISKMTDYRYENFKQADEVLSEYWSRIKYNGKTWTARDVEIYRTNNNLTWHEMNNMETMQLIPLDVNQRFIHYGGVAEYKAMIGQEVVSEFD